MQTVIVHTNDEEQLELIQRFLKENHLTGRVLTEENKEDIILAKLMEETDNDEEINTEEFLQKLRS